MATAAALFAPQQPMYQQQPMQPPPKKKSKTWLWIVLGVIAVLVLGCICASALAFNAAKNVSHNYLIIRYRRSNDLIRQYAIDERASGKGRTNYHG